MHAHGETATVTDTERADAPEVTGQAGDGQAPNMARLMIPVSDLTAHPGNTRDDLNLTEEFLASIAAEGVRIPLLITPSPGPDGGWRVIEGHRRLAAAVKIGLAEVPCDIRCGGHESFFRSRVVFARNRVMRLPGRVKNGVSGLVDQREAYFICRDGSWLA
jgi:ParB-like nuclease domain